MLTDIHHKARWVFSPLVYRPTDGAMVPLVEDYTVKIDAPMYYNGYALCHCIMNAQQLAAARKDARCIVLDSIHSTGKIPKMVAEHHASHGVKESHTVYEMLVALSAYAHGFEPQN